MKPTEVTRRYHDAWNGRDADALVAIFTKDGTFCRSGPIPAPAEKLLPNI
ncbi:MAG TPA: nuclear transport factor 2 family protein [Terrimicrobiaceae bacterium]